MSETNERPADLVFWFKDGCVCGYNARVPADAKVSIGRTNSKRALGFIVSHGDERIDFVLNKDQVAELVAYLTMSLPRLLKPRGRKPSQISLAAILEHGTSKRRSSK